MLAWILWIVGTLGIGGLIALAIFAPLLARELLGVVLDVFGRLWRTRGGVGLIVGSACLLFGYFYFDSVGASRVKEQWDAANAQAKARTEQADADAKTRAQKLDEQNAAAEAAADHSNEEARNAYIADLEKRAASVCVDSDADVKRLLNKR